MDKNLATLTKPSFLAGLNQEQLQAAEILDGPLLVLAGAGTGKTRVLVSRIANLLLTGKAAPGEILSVTFTNKAALEMTERVNKLTSATGMWLGTFHALAVKILRRHADYFGLESSFTIIDIDDQIRLVKKILTSFDIDEKKFPAKLVLNVIQKWKDLGLTPSKLTSSDLTNPVFSIAEKVYKEYQTRLRAIDSVDFGDLLLYNVELFVKNPQILDFYQKLFKYILVDEYQDTNAIQYSWLRMLADGHKNICCVGDED